jgi:uncharacterized cupredoxin-like copper-binding protein
MTRNLNTTLGNSIGRRHAAVAICGAAAGLALLPSAGAAFAASEATTVTVAAGTPTEFGFKLSTKSFPHGAVTFKVTNRGTIPHDFKICASAKGGTANACAGTGTPQINPGSTATLKYTFKAKGTYEYLCTVPGHAAGGMKGDVKVT